MKTEIIIFPAAPQFIDTLLMRYKAFISIIENYFSDGNFEMAIYFIEEIIAPLRYFTVSEKSKIYGEAEISLESKIFPEAQKLTVLFPGIIKITLEK